MSSSTNSRAAATSRRFMASYMPRTTVSASTEVAAARTTEAKPAPAARTASAEDRGGARRGDAEWALHRRGRDDAGRDARGRRDGAGSDARASKRGGGHRARRRGDGGEREGGWHRAGGRPRAATAAFEAVTSTREEMVAVRSTPVFEARAPNFSPSVGLKGEILRGRCC